VDEYEQLHRLRELWSRAIITWAQIFVPLGAAIIAVFVSQLPSFADRGLGTHFLLVGWVLFSSCIICWRCIAHRIDKQIVGMYPRMLELEKKSGMETQTAYYYRNLSRESKNYLADKLNIPFNEIKNQDFRGFKRKVSQKGNAYDFLLEVWDKFRRKSVTCRGHVSQDGVGVALIVGSLIAIILVSKLGWFN